jgi:hypothetical protein
MFVYGGAGWTDVLPTILEMYGTAFRAPFEAQLGGRSGDISKTQAHAVLQTLNASSARIRMPELVFGFKLSNAGPAANQMKRLEDLLTPLLAKEPKLKGRLKRSKVAGADALTFTLDSSLLPLDQIRWSDVEEQEGEFQKLRQQLKKLTLAVSLLVKDNYLLLTVGPTVDVAEKFGGGTALATRPELTPLAKFADRKLISVGYVSKAMIAGVTTRAEDLTSLVDMAKNGLDKLPIPEKRREAIDKDLKKLAKELADELPSPGAVVAFTFLSDRGQEGYSYDYGTTPGAPAPKPLTILDHLGASPLTAIAAATNDPTPAYQWVVKWMKTIYGHAEATVKEMFPDNWQQFEQGLDLILPYLKKFDEITGTQFLPALGDGQVALVVDAKWTSKQWFKEFDQGGNELPMLEIGFVRTVKDSAKLVRAMRGYRELLNEILEKAKQFRAPIPEGGLPAPESKKVAGGTAYYWSLPDAGQDAQVQPNVALSDAVLAVTASVKHSERLLATTPNPLAAKQPLLSVAVVDFAGFFAAVRPWFEFGLPMALESVPDNAPPGVGKKDIPGQVRTLFDVLGCLRSYTSVTYREGAATVTHSELVISDLK